MAEPPEAWGPEAQLQRRRGNNKARSQGRRDRKSTRLNSSHLVISYAVFCLKKKKAHDGMAPHGLLIVATCSDKSNILRTLVLALAATHSSYTRNVVLVHLTSGPTLESLTTL